MSEPDAGVIAEQISGAELSGAEVVARSLRQQGVTHIFGVIGVPVTPIAEAAQRAGIRYIGMRNEQAASYAAQAAGYLTGRPQACLVVSGPGVVHALAGLANAQANCWPMLLIGGSAPTYQEGMGAFQEERQLLATTPFTKLSRRVERTERIPFFVEQAVRTALFGRPGATYLDLPEEVIEGRIDAAAVPAAPTVGESPRSEAPVEAVEAALRALASAERPLVVVGKGMAWARAEAEVRELIDRTQLPFLATPMGKGVVPDSHPLSVAAARSTALREADMILLLGARLNWMLHFGQPPRFRPDVRVLQLDVTPEQIGANVPAEVALVGDGRAVTRQLLAALEARPWHYAAETTWRTTLARKAEENAAQIAPMLADDRAPMNYYRALREIREALPAGAVIVSEGANTMDIGRTLLPNEEPRRRLDAGTQGTMGVGLGYAIAAAAVDPGRPVVAVEGDSAFGFSGMELETAARHGLPITVVVLNNGGIGSGMPTEPPPAGMVAPGALSADARYERIAEAFGGVGFRVERPEELGPALRAALASGLPSVVTVAIDPQAGRKPQQFHWNTRLDQSATVSAGAAGGAG